MSIYEQEIIHRIPQARHSLKAIAAAAASVVAACASAAEPGVAGQPKLVVGIMVEDLRSEYLSLLKDNFVQGGFNMLINDGVAIPNTDFGTTLDAAAATAVIFTGASPSLNGVPSGEVFDAATLRPRNVFHDAETMGNYSTLTLSPSALAMTTISDELRVAGGGISYAYAFAADPDQALVMAGHAGNCGMWINDANESWATTTFYKDVPQTLTARNRFKPLRSRIDTMTWAPSRSKAAYPLLPKHITDYPYKYTFRKPGPETIREFKASPRSNDEITDFTIENLHTLHLGQHANTDMISVAYTLAPYEYSKTADNRFELFDAYYRLDHNLQQLFSAVDKTVGLQNVLIFLSGTPQTPYAPVTDEKWMLPYGEFSTNKAISLLNLYLIARYGNGDWVQAYHNGHFFLNRKLADEKGLDIRVIRVEAARFLERMAGVYKAFSIDEIIDNRSADLAPIKRNTAMQHAGDVRAYIMPGWQIIDDYNTAGAAARTDKVVRSAAAVAPAFIYAPGVAPRKISSTVDARAIAPTVSSLLRIRSPNGASEPPLVLE